MTPMPDCPPRHTPYASRSLAENAATLHTLSRPNCRGYAPFPCGDHWHCGHTSPLVGDKCKNDPEHNATRRRLQRLGLL